MTLPEKLSRGERRMLEDRKLIEFVKELYQPISPSRKAKHTGKNTKQAAKPVSRLAARKGGK